MTGLTDMEELIALVPERDLATYLREAFVCYGAGAYRGCIVLVHTALFEGLRMKLHAVATSNAAAKAVLAVIEPDAAAQKVFEQKLVDQMRVHSIITQLEADILVQLNKQRNKAAHPSGHMVTAEEARFVFSEAVKKFLSRPIRQTSVLVDAIIARLPDPNLFPSSMMPDIALVVDQETENLDPSAMPELLAKLATAHGGADAAASANSTKVVLALAGRKDAATRASIIKKFVAPKSSNDAYAETITELVTTDPELLPALSPADRLRVCALLMKNAAAGKISLYQELRNPAHALASMAATLGEAAVLTDYKPYADHVLANSPGAPNFVLALAASPTLLASLQDHYRRRASHGDFNVANAFAGVLPGLDAALAQVSTAEESLWMLASVVRAAGYGAFGAIDLANNQFEALPALKAKATALYVDGAGKAAIVLDASGYPGDAATFGTTYLGMP
jgi:hypothetical protein